MSDSFMKTPEQVRDEAALAWCAEHQYSSHMDRGHAFKSGYDYAVKHDPRVLALVDALNWYAENGYYNQDEIAIDALKAWEGER